MTNKTKCYITLIIVAIMIIVSIILRIPKEDERYNNSDATYHVLLTMKCYEETPASIHKFLPIVSLGDEEDKNISWGSCVKDENGNYYYTSFSSAGFVAPYLFIKTFNLPINIYSLYAFNSMICIITVILTIYIFCKLFERYIDKDWIILFTAIIYLFQMEVMHSQGAIYWTQSIFQMLIAVQFILFLNWKSKKSRIAFFIMCLIMPYIEWTGYVSNVAFAVIIFIQNIIKDKKITIKTFGIPALIGVLTVAAFALFSIHYLLNIDFEQYITALKSRFLARNITSNKVGIIHLLKGYIVSYKYTLALISVLLIVILSLKKYRKTIWDLIKEYKYSIIYFGLIMLENIIMLQHAEEYTFDRLKLMYIIITLFFIILATICIECKNKKNIIKGLAIILVCISMLNIIDYKKGFGNYITSNTHESSNKMLAEYIKENYKHSNSVVGTNHKVRGYINLLFDRGIYEFLGYEQAEKIAIQKNKQFVIYIIREEELIIKEILIKDLKNDEQYKLKVEKDNLVKETV